MLDASFWLDHWFGIIFSLITAGVLGYCKSLNGKYKRLRQLVKEKDEEELEVMMQSQIQPLSETIEVMEDKFIALREFCKYHIISMCERFLNRGYLTTKEYSYLTEYWKFYHEGLHGNGQAEDYYHRVIETLDIHEMTNDGQ